MNLRLYLVRHGITVFNVLGRIQGWCDSPLTPKGREVAVQLGNTLGSSVIFDSAYASTSPRALDTAGLILQAKGQATLGVNPLPDLREYFFGGLEGELIDTVYERLAAHFGQPDVESWLRAYRHGDRNMLAEGGHALDPLGLAESEAAFSERVWRGMDSIVQQSRPGQTVLLVSHGLTITTILKAISPANTLRKSIRNATPVRLDYRDGQWSLADKEIIYS